MKSVLEHFDVIYFNVGRCLILVGFYFCIWQFVVVISMVFVFDSFCLSEVAEVFLTS
jgi:hypothetical protein